MNHDFYEDSKGSSQSKQNKIKQQILMKFLYF